MTGLTKLILSLKVIFFPLILNKAAMYFVFVNVALLERGVGTSFSSQGIRKLFLPRIRLASQLIKTVAHLLTSILSFLSGKVAQYFHVLLFLFNA